MPELRRIYAMSHLPYSYPMQAPFIPFVLGRNDAHGDNIADRAAWSEGRGHYWLWKNVWFDPDEFVAISQYRRCFFFPPLIRKHGPFSVWAELLNRALAQTVLAVSRQEYIGYVRFVEESERGELNEWLSAFDIVVNRPLEYPRSIATIYGEHHRANDWEIFAAICRKYGFDEGKHNFLHGHFMYMMRPEIFDWFMTDWWKVMSEVDALVQHEDHPYQHRKIGYLSERFMSAWLIKARMAVPTLRILNLPIIEGLFQLDRESPGVM